MIFIIRMSIVFQNSLNQALQLLQHQFFQEIQIKVSTMINACEIARLVIQKPLNFVENIPHLEYSAGEQLDPELILTALLPDLEARTALTACPELQLVIVARDGGTLDRSVFETDNNDEFIIKSTQDPESHNPILLTLWANFNDYSAHESLGEFAVKVVASNMCSYYLRASLQTLEGQFKSRGYLYGGAELQINPMTYELVPDECNLIYQCKFLGILSNQYEEIPIVDLCAIVNNTLTKVTFDENTGSFGLSTTDSETYPPGRYILEISGTDGSTTVSSVLEVDIAGSRGSERDLHDTEGIIQKNSFWQESQAEQKMTLAEGHDLRESARNLQDCTPTIPDFGIQEHVIFGAQQSYVFPSFSDDEACNYSYVFDYGVLGAIASCQGSEFKPFFENRMCTWRVTEDFDLLDGQDFKDYPVLITGTSSSGGGESDTGTITLRLMNPCLDLSASDLTGMFINSGQTYSVFDSEKTLIVSPPGIADSKYNVCGGIETFCTFENLAIDSTTTPMAFYSASHELKIYSEDLALAGVRAITSYAQLTDYPSIKSVTKNWTIEIINPCLTATPSIPEFIIDTPDYYYASETQLEWSYQMSNFIVTNPTYCKGSVQMVSCSAHKSDSSIITTDCNFESADIKVSFDTTSLTYTFKTSDIVTYPPIPDSAAGDFYYFQQKWRLGQNSGTLKIGFKLKDPCPFQTLSIIPINVLTSKAYELRYPALTYKWTFDQMFMKGGGSLVDCGPYTFEIFNADDLQPLDSNLFEVTLDSISSLEVKYTEDFSVAGSYDIRYLVFYDNYILVGDEQLDPFTVTIIDPCESPKYLVAPENLSELVKVYTITGPQMIFEFGQFILEPSWCEVSYTYTIDDPLGELVIVGFDDLAQSFTFEYGQDLAPLENDILQDSTDYMITISAISGTSLPILSEATFTLRVVNPCSKTVGFAPELMPDWCPKGNSTYWNPQMPEWQSELMDVTIYVGESFTYSFGDAVNRYDQDVEVSMELGSTKNFAYYDKKNNNYIIMGEFLVPGYWKLNVVTNEVKNGRTYVYEKYFYLHVLEKNFGNRNIIIPVDPDTGIPIIYDEVLKKESLIREEEDYDKPMPYVINFDSTGLMQIGWSRKLNPPPNYPEIPQAKLVVSGNPRQLQEANRVVPVRENSEEFDLLIRTIVELEALEVNLVDQYKDKLDIEFSWDIVGYTSDDVLLQFDFQNPNDLSNDEAYSIQITFWETKFFKDEKGSEVPFGTEINWEVFRQMKRSDFEYVDRTLNYSYIVMGVIGVFLLLLALTCGTLLPFWMFLNSMQLMVHVPLIRTTLPGNAHYFFLQYLNILRLQFWSFNTWLQEITSASKASDSAMVENKESEYYTTLIFSCGYSFSFLPNLILIICLFSVILFIWLLLLGRDVCLRPIVCRTQEQGQNARRQHIRSRAEPRMTNFCIRFLYEVFFEICLCTMINASFVDFDQKSQLIAWGICIFLALVTFIALIAITVLFWKKGGPSVRDAFEQRSLWSSFWGTRPLRVSTMHRLIMSKEDQKLFKLNKIAPSSISDNIQLIDKNEEDDIEKQVVELKGSHSQKFAGQIIAPKDIDFFIQSACPALKSSQIDNHCFQVPEQLHSSELRSGEKLSRMRQTPEFDNQNYEGGEIFQSSNREVQKELETSRELLPAQQNQPDLDSDSQAQSKQSSQVKLKSTKVDLLALKALMTVEARIRVKLESLSKPSDRYRTLFYGLKRNHPHSAAVMHPLFFLLRRIIYATIVLFMINLPIIGAYILCVICLGMLAFIIVENQWEESVISLQHFVNEIALYLILLSVIASSLPIASAAVSPLGWFMIVVFLATLIFNMVIIVYLTILHLRMYLKRHRRKFICKKSVKKDQVIAQKKKEVMPQQLSLKAAEEENLERQGDEFASLADLEREIGMLGAGVKQDCSNPTEEPMLIPSMNIPIKLEYNEKELYEKRNLLLSLINEVDDALSKSVPKSPVQEMLKATSPQRTIMNESIPQSTGSISNECSIEQVQEAVSASETAGQEENTDDFIKTFIAIYEPEKEDQSAEKNNSKRVNIALNQVEKAPTSTILVQPIFMPMPLEQAQLLASMQMAADAQHRGNNVTYLQRVRHDTVRLTAAEILNSAKQEVAGLRVRKRSNQSRSLSRRSRYQEHTHSTLNKAVIDRSCSVDSDQTQLHTKFESQQAVNTDINLQRNASVERYDQSISLVKQIKPETPEKQDKRKIYRQQSELIDSQTAFEKSLPPLKDQQQSVMARKSIKKINHDMMKKAVSLKQTIAALNSEECHHSSCVYGKMQRIGNSQDSSINSEYISGELQSGDNSEQDQRRKSRTQLHRTFEDSNIPMVLVNQRTKQNLIPNPKTKNFVTPSVPKLTQRIPITSPVMSVPKVPRLFDELKMMNSKPTPNIDRRSNVDNCFISTSLNKRQSGMVECNFLADSLRKRSQFGGHYTNKTMDEYKASQLHGSAVQANRSVASSLAHEIDHFGQFLPGCSDYQQELSLDDFGEIIKIPRTVQKLAFKARGKASPDLSRKIRKTQSTAAKIPVNLPRIKNMKSGGKEQKMNKTSKAKSTSIKMPQTTNVKREDPYDAQQYLVNNIKQNNARVKRIQGSYIPPGYEHELKVIVPDHQIQLKQVRTLMKSQGDCLERKHYRCGCTKHRQDLLDQDSIYQAQNPAQLMSYSNAIGFKDGMIFPVAGITNPQMMGKTRSYNL